MLAASGWPKMPKTPHSSLNLSIFTCGGPHLTACAFAADAVGLGCDDYLLVKATPLAAQTSARSPSTSSFALADRQSIAPAPPTAIRIAVPPTRPTSAAGTPAAAARASTAVTLLRRGRHDDARRRFAEQRRRVVDRRVSGHVDAADRRLDAGPVRVEAALGERHRRSRRRSSRARTA